MGGGWHGVRCGWVWSGGVVVMGWGSGPPMEVGK